MIYFASTYTKPYPCQLLALNKQVADKEAKGLKVQAPGLPDFISNTNEFITKDCIQFLR